MVEGKGLNRVARERALRSRCCVGRANLQRVVWRCGIPVVWYGWGNCALALVKFSSARNGFGVSQISSVEMSMHECIHANALTDPGSCRPTQTRSTTSFPSRPAPRRTKICFPPHKNFPQKYFRSTKTFHRTTQQRKKEKKKREKNSECLNCSNQ